MKRMLCLLLFPGRFCLLETFPAAELLLLDLRSLFEVLRLNGGFLLLAELLQLFTLFSELFRLSQRGDTQLRGGLIDQIDGLVRQVAVADIAGRKLHRCRKRRGLNHHLVMLLIAGTHALQDLQRFLLRGLIHHHRLETPLQRRILFDVLPVLLQCRGADDLQLSPGQSRLQDIGRIQCALRTAGTDNGMNFVNKQQDLTVILRLLNDPLDPLLKLAPVLGAGHHAGNVQGQQPLSADGLRHAARNDSLGNAFGHGGLSHAGLTDEAGIVFGSAGKDLHHPHDLGLSSHHGIQLSLGGHLRQVSGIPVQHRRPALLLLPASAALVRADSVPRCRQDLLINLLCIGAECRNDA